MNKLLFKPRFFLLSIIWISLLNISDAVATCYISGPSTITINQQTKFTFEGTSTVGEWWVEGDLTIVINDGDNVYVKARSMNGGKLHVFAYNNEEHDCCETLIEIKGRHYIVSKSFSFLSEVCYPTETSGTIKINNPQSNVEYTWTAIGAASILNTNTGTSINFKITGQIGDTYRFKVHARNTAQGISETVDFYSNTYYIKTCCVVPETKNTIELMAMVFPKLKHGIYAINNPQSNVVYDWKIEGAPFAISYPPGGTTSTVDVWADGSFYPGEKFRFKITATIDNCELQKVFYSPSDHYFEVQGNPINPKGNKSNANQNYKSEVLINCYPNPTSGRINIDYSIMDDYTSKIMEIKNSKGISIKRIELESYKGIIELNLDNEIKGTYFVNIILDGKNIAQNKIIIN